MHRNNTFDNVLAFALTGVLERHCYLLTCPDARECAWPVFPGPWRIERREEYFINLGVILIYNKYNLQNPRPHNLGLDNG